jgi:hypothetical protein
MDNIAQAQKKAIGKRRFLCSMAGFHSNRQLQRELEAHLRRTVNYFTLSKVMDGSRTTGPEARIIMQAIAQLVGKPESYLWPKQKRAPKLNTA